MSTREVEGVLSLVDFLQQVNVYGVSVPGARFRSLSASSRSGAGLCVPGFPVGSRWGGRELGCARRGSAGAARGAGHSDPCAPRV